MANNKFSDDEHILVKVDQNNLIYVDPNSVVDKNGIIQKRNVPSEKLATYINLEADIIPRSILSATNDQRTLTSIASGTLNFLKNQSGKDYDTSWTEAYSEYTQNIQDGKLTDSFHQSDKSSQSLGIQSVSIQIKGANFIPHVDINFIDVRGKTLFEAPDDSPYNAFFHLPWPIFYLTVKGYYGQSIRYRLHLVKFTSKYNEANGNFDVATTFIGSTYAWMNDIPLKGLLYAPYMFAFDTSDKPTYNSSTGQYNVTVKKSARGYELLKTVFAEYKELGLLDPTFPVKTLKELVVIAKSLDKILESQIFGGENNSIKPQILQALKQSEDVVGEYQRAISSWVANYTLTKSVDINGVKYQYQSTNAPKKDTEFVLGKDSDGHLENIIITYNNKIADINKLVSDVKNTNKNIPDLQLGHLSDISNYYSVDTSSSKEIVIAVDKLNADINDINKKYNEKKQSIYDYLEQIINSYVKDPSKGIGFAPTIRNIFAVILANAEVYVRLMKETHQKAFQVGEKRKELLKNFSIETKSNNNIYPWPEVRKKTEKNKQWVIAYPAGSNEMVSQLQSNNKQLWPEVDFLENFYKISTLVVDPNGGEKEGSISNVNFTFDSNVEKSNTKNVGAISTLLYAIPYIDETPVSILYEIWERSYYLTLFDSFNNETIQELSKIEFTNLTNIINNDIDDNTDIISLLNNKAIGNIQDFEDNLLVHSPYNRYPYLQDQIPTVPYIKSIVNNPYKLEQYIKKSSSTNTNNVYSKLQNQLKVYNIEEYRKNIYPFSSDLFSYYLINNINSDVYTPDVKGLSLNVDTTEGLICSPVSGVRYVKSGFETNLFSQQLDINNGGIKANILNTPYFHQQLYTDFTENTNYGRYAGSAYLLLNSLPFLDLTDELTEKGQITFVSNLFTQFKEIGSTHFIPYHLILKWGSIYHRYKKFIIDGVDILSGFLKNDNTTLHMVGSFYFDYFTNDTFNVNYKNVSYDITYNNHTDIGIHPYYDSIFHQIVNGYTHYDPYYGSTSFENNVMAGGIIEIVKPNGHGLNYWTQYVDNSKYGNSSDKRYTILPSSAYQVGSSSDTFIDSEQNNLRIIWSDDMFVTSGTTFSGVTFPGYTGVSTNYIGDYSLGNQYRKVIDLIGTFSPDMLDEFESIFLDFASDVGTISSIERPNKRFSTTKYTSFQNLLRDIVSLSGVTQSNSTDTMVVNLGRAQEQKLKDITNIMLSNDNLVRFTISNPKEIDPHVLFGFTQTTITKTFGNTLTFNPYNSIQDENEKYIELYVGEDISGFYKEFFVVNDIELSEDNVLQLRTLILIYAGWVNDQLNTNPSFVLSKEGFQQYLIDNVLTNFSERFGLFLQSIINQFPSLKVSTIQEKPTNIVNGYNNEPVKIELYNNFKSFNDKWVAGNSIGQRTLIEEFLFLDRANRDIGDEFYLDLTKLIGMVDNSNLDSNLYSALSELINGTGLDIRPLPAYVNFYGSDYNNRKYNATQKTASDLFGTFLEVNYQEASPKIVIQLVGENSKHLDNSSSDNKFNDDSFDCSMVNNNPLIVSTNQALTIGDLTKSNKAVSFEIAFGDQNNGIFKSITLDQATIRNTAASSYVIENFARSESGANAVNIDISLYDYYRTAAYSCEVTMLGNVMIQPTMFFYLKNVPMFKGTYWITEVYHDIRNNQIITRFKGARVPMGAFPDPKDSFAASYKTLFDKLTATAASIINQTSGLPDTAKTIYDKVNGHLIYDYQSIQKWESKDMFNETSGGITPFGVPYNGFSLYGNNDGRYVVQIKYKGTTYLRAKVTRMGGAYANPGDSNGDMLIINNLSVTKKAYVWKDLEKFNDTSYFYSMRFEVKSPNSYDNIMTKSSIKFYNPAKDKGFNVNSKFTTSNTDITFVSGPVDVNVPDQFGIAMSKKLMTDLGLNEGDFVYFTGL